MNTMAFVAAVPLPSATLLMANLRPASRAWPVAASAGSAQGGLPS